MKKLLTVLIIILIFGLLIGCENKVDENVISQAGNIKGYAIDNVDSEPMGNVLVSIRNSFEEDFIETVETDVNGTFIFNEVEPGEMYLHFAEDARRISETSYGLDYFKDIRINVDGGENLIGKVYLEPYFIVNNLQGTMTSSSNEYKLTGDITNHADYLAESIEIHAVFYDKDSNRLGEENTIVENIQVEETKSFTIYYSYVSNPVDHYTMFTYFSLCP